MKKDIKGRQIFKTSAIVLMTIYLIILIRLIMFKYPSFMTMEILKSWSIKSVLFHIKHETNIIPFRTIVTYIIAYKKQTMNENIIFYNLVGNIIALAPFGFLLPLVKDKLDKLKEVFKVTVVFILTIEVTQLVTKLGNFDIDDVILNTLGAMMGYWCYRIAKSVFEKLISCSQAHKHGSRL